MVDGRKMKSAKMIRAGRTVIIAGQRLKVTAIETTRDATLGELVVIICGDRSFRRPPSAKVEVI